MLKNKSKYEASLIEIEASKSSIKLKVLKNFITSPHSAGIPYKFSIFNTCSLFIVKFYMASSLYFGHSYEIWDYF